MSLFSTKVERMTPGQVLMDAPISEMIKNLGKGIAEAQKALDENAIAMAIEMAQTTTAASDKSLLELGLTPTFYQVTEAELEVKLEMTMRVEQEVGIELGIELGDGTPASRAGAGNSITIAWDDEADVVGKTLSLSVGGTAHSVKIVANSATPAAGEVKVGADAEATATAVAAKLNAAVTDLNATAKADGDDGVIEWDFAEDQDLAFTPANDSHLSFTEGKAPKKAKKKTKNSPIAWGVSVNAHYHRRYELEVSGSSKVTWKLVALPPPSQLMDELQGHTVEE